MASKYRCSTPTCDESIKRSQYLCPKCWDRLPYRYKDRLVETYEKGQLKTEYVPMDFVRVLGEAVEWLAEEHP